MRVAEVARRAELMARASMLKEKRQFEVRELEMIKEKEDRELKIKQDREEHALRAETREADARMEAILKEEANLEGRVYAAQPPTERPLRAEAKSFEPREIPLDDGRVVGGPRELNEDHAQGRAIDVGSHVSTRQIRSARAVERFRWR